MKKLFALLTACTAMVCAFGSCGDKNENSDSESPAVSDSAESETESDNTSADSTEQVPVEVITQPETHEYLEDADRTSFAGKWECDRLVANGEELEELQGLPAYAVFQYDLLEDGTVKLPDSLMAVSDTENPTEYKWGIISETEIEITGSNGSVIVYTLDNGQLSNIENNREIHLKKVDEFTYFDFQAYYDAIMASMPGEDEYVLTPIETDANGDVVSRGEPVPIE